MESVERLPGLDKWSPSHGFEIQRTELIRWGHALWMTRSLPGVESLQQTIAGEILASGRPAPETFAELDGAALCVALGAVAAGRIPRGSDRTADWRMVWPGDANLDLEITIAKRKKKHMERAAFATDLANAIFALDRDFDLVVDLADSALPKDRDMILEKAETIASGQTQGDSSKWQMRALQITRAPTVLYSGGQDPQPSWWPADQSRCFVFKSYVAGPDAHHAPPQVRICFGVPYDSYVNPIMRKADAPQGTEGLPFLVAVDIADLPGAFREIPRVVSGFLPFWRAVSGILLFHSMMNVDRVGWLWRLLRNPHADVALPEELCAGRADLEDIMETGVQLTEYKSNSEAV
ncbi:MAG: hypothetical protein EPO27_15925 [Betaproteobacteria bacterium]|nr:MAG: hypothetical protein EPO27_15925 [Betaproteobacteria bacterium]